MQANQNRQAVGQNRSIAKLAECFRSELSAVETYELALKNVNHVGLHKALQEILVSHSRRTAQLRDKIRAMGAEPPVSSGIWGAFARAFQVGADLLGDRVVVAALEEGEDHTLDLYMHDRNGVDARTLKLIDQELLVEQRRTHDLCRSLQAYVSAPS